jgi:ribosome-binding ATPase YchF (GTP1/OBG family)
MKIGIVGYQSSGKSSMFRWLTGVEPDLSLAHTMQMATAAIVDPRMERLTAIYEPKKITHAMLTIVDTPGLNRSHEGSAAKLAVIREAGCLVIVVAAFAGAKASDDLQSFQEDLLLADLEIVGSRVERLRESVKKPRPNREKELLELAALEPILAHLEASLPLHTLELNPEQTRTIRSFQLLTKKPQFVVVNVSDIDSDPNQQLAGLPADVSALAVSVTLQMELEQMTVDQRTEFCQEMGVQPFNRDQLIQRMMNASGQMLFFTAGDKEVRTWIIPQAATAEDAAAGIHTDLARGFVRAEVMTCDDLFRVGSEREIKARNLMRKEHKDYVIQDGDVVHILANV